MALAVFLLLIGAVLALVGGGTLRTERRKAREGVVTDGVVVDHVWRRNGGRSGTRLRACPVVEYQGPSGQRQRFADSSGLGHPLAPGTPVRVRHDPSRPDRAPELASGWARMLLPTILLAVGSLMAAGALLGVVSEA